MGIRASARLFHVPVISPPNGAITSAGIALAPSGPMISQRTLPASSSLMLCRSSDDLSRGKAAARLGCAFASCSTSNRTDCNGRSFGIAGFGGGPLMSCALADRAIASATSPAAAAMRREIFNRPVCFISSPPSRLAQATASSRAPGPGPCCCRAMSSPCRESPPGLSDGCEPPWRVRAWAKSSAGRQN